MLAFPSELQWIDSQYLIILERIKRWVKINTYSKNFEGLNHFLHHFVSDFSSLDGITQLIALPSQTVVGPKGHLFEEPLGQAFSIRKRTQASKQVLLAGHYDTVYTPTHHFQTLNDSQPDIWRGPGVADMKGGLAVLLTTLEAFERSPLANQLGWEVLITPDEEIGSPGSGPLYEEAAQRHHYGLVFEPTLPSGAFVNERKGSISYTLIVKGRTAHVGRDFGKGRSAVFALAHGIEQLNQLNAQDLTVNVTDLEGEGPLNIVPDLALCRVNFRSFSVERLLKTTEQLHQIADQLMKQEGIHVEIIEQARRLPKNFASCQSIFHAYALCAEALQIPFALESTGGVCDGNILAEAGLPTLDTAGVIGGALHTSNEYMITSSLIERSKLATLFLLNLAAGEFS